MKVVARVWWRCGRKRQRGAGGRGEGRGIGKPLGYISFSISNEYACQTVIHIFEDIVKDLRTVQVKKNACE